MSFDKSEFILPNNQPVVLMQCKPAFNALTSKEKLYAHYLSRASWYGGFIASIQISPESPLILALLHNIFLLDSDIAKLRETALAAKVTDEEFTAFLIYASGIYDNMGNYKSFGDTKFIPNLPQDKFEAIVKSTKIYQQNTIIALLWHDIKDVIYNLDSKLRSLGIGDKGVTTYFSSNCVEEDMKKVTEFMLHKKMQSLNTRVFKTVTDNKVSYEIRLASIETNDKPPITVPEETFNGSTFKVTRGDYSELLKHVVENLEKAVVYAADDIKKDMLQKYISHFTTGCLDDHIDGSRYWIKDKGPVVETYIGFIETYRDPAGERAEFEGFVAIVDKIMSEKFATLVKNAPKFLEQLPWGKEFEKDVFLKPDFTSLDILTFAGSMVPSGINIPNYDSIRQTEGFKNVYLANVINTPMPPDSYYFLSDKDLELVQKYRLSSVQIQVGLHELLGHGSGKLLTKSKNDSYNFDHERMINPLTGKKIDKWYVDGETYDVKFGSLGSSYEECRAEAVALYLSLDQEIMKIFGFENEEADEVCYVTWLMMMWAGTAKALEMYQPEKKQWLQSHSQARYVLLQVCLEAGEGFVTVTETEKGKNLLLTVDKSKIYTVGKRAIGDFLKKLQIYKSTGDIEEARKLYNKYSEVSDDGKHPWATWRNIVLAHKKPRKFLVQPNTFVNDAKEVTLKNYEPTYEGIIQSWLDRFPDAAVMDTLMDLYKKDAHHFELENATS